MSETNEPSPATTAVLHTTELLELILLSLAATAGPRAFLASIPRVCRRWRATLAASLPLRRALFLAPVPDRGALRPLNPPGQAPANHCAAAALPRALQPVVNDGLARRFRLGRFDEPDAEYDGGYMPMVSMRWLDELRGEWLLRREGDGEKGEGEKSGSGGGGCEPSWRKMLITQPPPRRVEILLFGTNMFQSVKEWVECEEGVTLGLLHDKCQGLAGGRDWQKRSMGWYFEL